MDDISGEIEGAINSNQRAMKVQSMDQRAIGSESNRRSNGSRAWEERWDIEQWKERWVREQALDQGAIELAMDITSGVEGAMDEGTSNESGSKGWIKEKFKGAMDQGASI
jgi:hypothetical protein